LIVMDEGRRGEDASLRQMRQLLQAIRGQYVLSWDGLHGVGACAGHTTGRWHPDPTVQACWDSDRLDLLRAGIRPDPARLGSEAARRLIDWASDRAESGVVPDFVEEAWATVARPWIAGSPPLPPGRRPRRRR
jgi:hypothetical protein